MITDPVGLRKATAQPAGYDDSGYEYTISINQDYEFSRVEQSTAQERGYDSCLFKPGTFEPMSVNTQIKNVKWHEWKSWEEMQRGGAVDMIMDDDEQGEWVECGSAQEPNRLHLVVPEKHGKTQTHYHKLSKNIQMN